MSGTSAMAIPTIMGVSSYQRVAGTDSGRCNQSEGAAEMPDEVTQNAFESGVKPLWLRAQAGDEAAYRDALERIADRLRCYLRFRMKGVPDDVEDLVQETLLALHLQRGTYDPSFPVGAWVLAIARHKLADLWRRRGRREDLHDTLDDVDEADLAAPPQEGEARRDLEKLLQELSLPQREAILLTKVEGMSVAEAAKRTGASESAIKVQVHRGLKRLAALVKGESNEN
ncbi:sigma-70 family RNA polymerase sigma factor [Cupriavidus sp. CP313]